MNSQVKDDFLTSFDELKRYGSVAAFSSVANDVDGAVYPSICLAIPDTIKSEYISLIENECGFKIKPNLVFLRSNPLGAKEPYQAHNDKNMGDYTAILYINPIGGTSFVEHKVTGMKDNNPVHFNEWLSDCNSYDEWSVSKYIEAKENRCLMFDSQLMHRGEPVEGHGHGNEARMIMVCFYERA